MEGWYCFFGAQGLHFYTFNVLFLKLDHFRVWKLEFYQKLSCQLVLKNSKSGKQFPGQSKRKLLRNIRVDWWSLDLSESCLEIYMFLNGNFSLNVSCPPQIQIFFIWILLFCELGAHAKFQNPTISKRERETRCL